VGSLFGGTWKCKQCLVQVFELFFTNSVTALSVCSPTPNSTLKTRDVHHPSQAVNWPVETFTYCPVTWINADIFNQETLFSQPASWSADFSPSDLLSIIDWHYEVNDDLVFNWWHRLLSYLMSGFIWCIFMKYWSCLIVGKVKSIGVFFAAGRQTNGLLQFKDDWIGLRMFPHCGSFSIGPRRLLPHAKPSGSNLKIDTCRVNFFGLAAEWRR